MTRILNPEPEGATEGFGDLKPKGVGWQLMWLDHDGPFRAYFDKQDKAQAALVARQGGQPSGPYVKPGTYGPQKDGVRLRNGRFQLRYRRRGREFAATFDSMEELTAAKRRMESSRFGGKEWHPLAGEMYFFDLVNDHWRKELDLAGATKEAYENRLRTYLLPEFGDRRIGDIERSDILGFRDELFIARAPATVKAILALGSEVCNYAVGRGWLHTNPFAAIRVRGAAKGLRPELPSEADMYSFLDFLQTEATLYLYAFACLGLDAGPRIGEMSGVAIRDVDFRAQAVTIARNWRLQNDRSGYELGNLKRGEERVVPTLSDKTAEVLARLAHGRHPDELLFAGPRGAPLRPDNFRARVWTPTVAQFNATLNEHGRRSPIHLTPHTLRHWAISFWLQHGVTPQEAAKWAGHADTTMITRVYGHCIPRTRAAEIEAKAILEAARAKIRTELATARVGQPGIVIPFPAREDAG